MDALLQVPPVAIDDDDDRSMFALLQLYPPEATVPLDGEPDADCGVDVLAIAASRERLEQFAADYQQRFRAALKEWEAWDDLSREWSEADDRKHDELGHKHRICGPLIDDVRWQIVEVWSGASAAD